MRSLLPFAVGILGLISFISGDVTGNHRIRAGGAAIIGAAVLITIAGWSLRRPHEAAQFDSRHPGRSLTQSSEQGLLIVRPDEAELYECAVRAFGAVRVFYDRRQQERRRGLSATTVERRQSERRHRAEADFEIKAFGSAWIRL